MLPLHSAQVSQERDQAAAGSSLSSSHGVLSVIFVAGTVGLVLAMAYSAVVIVSQLRWSWHKDARWRRASSGKLPEGGNVSVRQLVSNMPLAPLVSNMPPLYQLVSNVLTYRSSRAY
jgi:hypothetical protein